MSHAATLERETMSDPQAYTTEGVTEGEVEQAWDPNDDCGMRSCLIRACHI